MTIQPGGADLIIYKGATFNQPVQWTVDCCDPVNLTGCSAVFEAKYKLTDAEPFLELSSPDDGIVIDPLTGMITMNAGADTTADLDAGRGIYSLLITMSDDSKNYLLSGKITVQEMP